MKIGLQFPQFRPSTPETRRGWFIDILHQIEAAGFESAWMMDHFFQLGGELGDPETEMLEGYTTLGFFAGVTEKLKLGLMVGGVIYRPPALVIKSITTLDVLSGGRAIFGIGAAWNEFESKSLGMPFPSKKVRFEQLEDILQLAKHMWSGNTEPFEGKQFTLPYPVSNPQPLQKPHPMILVGGTGPQKTLRLVAKYADACNIFAWREPHELQATLDTLKQHCENEGRPYDEIEKTSLLRADFSSEATLQRTLDRAKLLRDLGFTYVIINSYLDYSPSVIDILVNRFAPEIQKM